MNIISASLCFLYAATIAICVGVAYRVRKVDTKGHYVFLQLPIAPQHALLMRLGLIRHLRKISWLGAYILLATPVFVILYGIGVIVEQLVKIHY
jgi:hypothetical protein